MNEEELSKASDAEEGVDYEADKAEMCEPGEAIKELPMEIWHPRDGSSIYAAMPDFL